MVYVTFTKDRTFSKSIQNIEDDYVFVFKFNSLISFTERIR